MDPLEVRTNCAYLIAAYLVIELKYTPEQAWEPFKAIGANVFTAFRDASDSPQDYSLPIETCLHALAKGIQLGWYNPRTFDQDEFEYLEDVNTADMHLITPKLAAFRGPADDTILYKGTYDKLMVVEDEKCCQEGP
jgi:cell division cycle 14